jgi:hypothetical protein
MLMAGEESAEDIRKHAQEDSSPTTKTGRDCTQQTNNIARCKEKEAWSVYIKA